MPVETAFWKDVLQSWFCYKNVYDKQEHLRINFIVYIPEWYNSNENIF